MLGMPYDAISTFLVFIIGVPALVIQSMDEEVRRAVMKEPLALVIRAGLPFVLALGIVFAASAIILVPWPGEASTAPNVPIAPTPGIGAATSMDRIAVAVEKQIAQAEEDQRAQNKREQVWTVTIIVLALLTAAASGLVLYEYGSRDRVIIGLTRPITTRLKKKGQLDEQALTVLIELGEQSQPGEDRQLVLVGMGKLAQQVREHQSYRGDSLEPLIDGLKTILVSDLAGNPKNFRAAIGILQEILMTPPTSPEQHSSDLFYAIRALSELSRAALMHIEQASEIEHLVLVRTGSLQSATLLYPKALTEVSQALLEIGVAAIEKKQTLAAITALDKLFGLVEANPPASGELVADTLGLASHFWVDGDTARKYVEAKLASTKGDLEQTWRKALEAARDHCARTMQFEAADNLDKMIAGLRKL